jgi:prepilin-type N-terminal cleavage/methylation domain-containing protein
MKKGCCSAGFSLLELLIALSITTFVASTVLMSFDSGLRAYSRIRDFGRLETEIYLAGERLEQDLPNMIPAATYVLQSREISFVRLASGLRATQTVRLHAPLEGGLYYRIGDDGGGAGRTGLLVVPDIYDVAFQFSSSGQNGVWLEDWGSTTNLPSAVRMIVDRSRAGLPSIVRTVLLYGELQTREGVF